MIDMYHTQKRVVQGAAEASQGGTQGADALARDRRERAGQPHSGRVWVRGFYRTQGGARTWVRGHWQAPGERVGRSSPE